MEIKAEELIAELGESEVLGLGPGEEGGKKRVEHKHGEIDPGVGAKTIGVAFAGLGGMKTEGIEKGD